MVAASPHLQSILTVSGTPNTVGCVTHQSAILPDGTEVKSEGVLTFISPGRAYAYESRVLGVDDVWTRGRHDFEPLGPYTLFTYTMDVETRRLNWIEFVALKWTAPKRRRMARSMFSYELGLENDYYAAHPEDGSSSDGLA